MFTSNMCAVMFWMLKQSTNKMQKNNHIKFNIRLHGKIQ